jgi:GNAT superfamily N-acetyltransferase
MFATCLVRGPEAQHQVFGGRYDEMEATLVFFDRHFARDRTFVAAMDGDQVIGLASIREGCRRVPGAFTLTFLSVREDRRRQGVAKLLVEGVFDFVQAHGMDLANTQYEEAGLKYLKPVLEAAATRRPNVGFHEFPVVH